MGFVGRLLDRGEATIDDVRDVVSLPNGIGPKVFGPIGIGLANAGIIQSVGMVKSKRPEAHGRKIELWRLKDRAAALRWLEANPLIPEPLAVESGNDSVTPGALRLIAEPLAVVSPPMTEGATALTAAPSTQRSLFS